MLDNKKRTKPQDTTGCTSNARQGSDSLTQEENSSIATTITTLENVKEHLHAQADQKFLLIQNFVEAVNNRNFDVKNGNAILNCNLDLAGNDYLILEISNGKEGLSVEGVVKSRISSVAAKGKINKKG